MPDIAIYVLINSQSLDKLENNEVLYMQIFALY